MLLTLKSHYSPSDGILYHSEELNLIKDDLVVKEMLAYVDTTPGATEALNDLSNDLLESFVRDNKDHLNIDNSKSYYFLLKDYSPFRKYLRIQGYKLEPKEGDDHIFKISQILKS